jgi:hypothetical protein
MRYPRDLLEVQSSALGEEEEDFQILEKKRIKLRRVGKEAEKRPAFASASDSFTLIALKSEKSPSPMGHLQACLYEIPKSFYHTPPCSDIPPSLVGSLAPCQSATVNTALPPFLAQNYFLFLKVNFGLGKF